MQYKDALLEATAAKIDATIKTNEAHIAKNLKYIMIS